MKEKFEELLESLTTKDLRNMTQECNSWNGSLDHLEYYNFDDEFFDMFENKMEVCRATCYGDVNFTDEYIHFNAYGNLESISEWEYEKELEDYKEEILETFIELYQCNNVYCDGDLKDRIDEYLETIIDDYEDDYEDDYDDDAYDAEDDYVEEKPKKKSPELTQHSQVKPILFSSFASSSLKFYFDNYIIH